MIHLVVFSFALFIANAHAYGTGAPEEACQDFIPGHGVDLQENSEAYFDLSFPNSFQNGKVIASASDDGSVKVTIKPNKDHKEDTFKGFLVQARYMNTDEPAGSFVIEDDSVAQHVSCDSNAPEATVTHTNNDDKEKVELIWSPPANAPTTTDYYFTYTVVKNYDTIWAARTSVFFSFQ